MKKNIEILRHMYEDIVDIENFTQGIDYNHFIDNHLVRKAVCMSLINIGELTKSLSAGFRAEHKAVPWKNIAGLRDVTAHKYHSLNLDVIWAVVIVEIPKLKQFIDGQLNRN